MRNPKTRKNLKALCLRYALRHDLSIKCVLRREALRAAAVREAQN